MTSFKFICDKCKKELIIVKDLKGIIQHFEIKDFFVIHCKDCILDRVIWEPTPEQYEAYKKTLEDPPCPP